VQHSETSIGNVTTGVFSVEVSCPTGKKAIGGGYTMSPAFASREVFAPSTRPNSSGTGWVVDFYGAFGTDTFTTYAICAFGG